METEPSGMTNFSPKWNNYFINCSFKHVLIHDLPLSKTTSCTSTSPRHVSVVVLGLVVVVGAVLAEVVVGDEVVAVVVEVKVVVVVVVEVVVVMVSQW